MSNNLRPDSYRIISLVDGKPPTSINLTRPAFQSVHLNGPVQIWKLTNVCDNVFRLAIGGYPYTGVVDNNVTASIFPEHDEEWLATYSELQDAYTISPTKDRRLGWTVPQGPEFNAVIGIKPIISTRSIPPLYLPSQLFVFEQVPE